MKARRACFAALWFLPLPLAAQAPSVITMDQEPHHHLVMKNDFVKIFNVVVAPGDSIVLHRHDGDTVAIAIGDQKVTVGIPNKPDVHQMNTDGQVRLQPSGYIHSTHVDGAGAYHTVAVELLRPQSGDRNLCATVLAGQPLNCPDAPASTSSANYTRKPQFESDQTRILLVRLLPHKSMNIAESSGSQDASQLIVALDPATISSKSGEEAIKTLLPGDFVWYDSGLRPTRTLQNQSDQEARIVEIIFPHTP
jgi:hypothetical protein